MKQNISIIIGGEAGYGVESLSKTISLFFTREGFEILTNNEYENRIRGGHVFSCVRIGEKGKNLSSIDKNIDILLAMDSNGLETHKNAIKNGGIIIFDPKKNRKIDKFKEENSDKNFIYLPVNFQEIAQKTVGMILARNVVGAGALLGFLDYPSENFEKVLEEIFEKKGKEVVEKNIFALKEGEKAVKIAKSEIGNNFKFNLKGKKSERFMMHGNDAIVLGCIKAGCKYLSAYPMTPGSSIMTGMAKYAKDYNIIVSHVEDEIAAVNNVIGAGYTGIRAMTSTSGGGFALMGEALSFAGMIESPALIVNAQRPGPSTGLSTRTGQGDLKMAINQGQGDFPILVASPGDHKECVSLSFEMFNLIEKFQLPAILLTDKYLADTYKSMDFIDFSDKEKWKIERGEIAKNLNKGEFEQEFFERYKDSESGISPRSLPGMTGGKYIANSYEHLETGHATEEIEKVVEMQNKRRKKIETLRKFLPMPEIFGEKNAEFTFVSWGSTKYAILEAIEELKEKGISANFVQIKFLHPLKTEIGEILKNSGKLILVENNESGQLGGILKENFSGLEFFKEIKKYNGRQITTDEIYEKIQSY
ncbi:2-oxoacid:acceptor oxidoreductase subunit alpha [Candidatus Gracilibacteria bacterium]|nr:2-oxoacid:acceptor oxidoreductase subunit alpha [Candidatus Gracilibacteria bacterium]